GQIYDQMFGAEEQHQLITFTQREQRALELGQKLQTKLLVEHLVYDPLTQPAEQNPCCPDCHQPGQLQKRKERAVRALTGEARWSRAVFYCEGCRRSFSPSRHG